METNIHTRVSDISEHERARLRLRELYEARMLRELQPHKKDIKGEVVRTIILMAVSAVICYVVAGWIGNIN